MIAYTVRRVLASIPLLLLLSVLTFVATRSISSPEAGIRTNPRVSAEDISRYREQLGLDDPASQQYFRWLGNLLQGDLGTSLVSNRDVWPELRTALANTTVLGVTAVTFSFLIGIGIGVFAAVNRNSPFDYATTGIAFFGLSMPSFWFAIMLQLFFGVYLVNWFGLDGPLFFTAGMRSPGTDGFDPVDRVRHLVLPALVLAVQLVAVYSRYMRASMLEVLRQDYMRTARAKGLKERIVIMKHGLRNALIPLITILALTIPGLIGGAIITETIFSWPGMGLMTINAIANNDWPVVQGLLVIQAFLVVFSNLTGDLLYGVVDPRIQYS